MPLQIKCASWEWGFASLFLARLPSVNKLSSFIWEWRKRSSLLLSCLLSGFYVVRYVRTETVNYGKWALMLAFRSKQYYRCQVSQAKKRWITAPFSCSHWGATFAKVFFQRIIRHFSLRDLSLDIYFWGSKVLLRCGAWMKSHAVRFLKRRNLDMGSWEEILENLTSKLFLQQVIIYGLSPDSK